jgi:hypothetical protein
MRDLTAYEQIRLEEAIKQVKGISRPRYFGELEIHYRTRQTQTDRWGGDRKSPPSPADLFHTDAVSYIKEEEPFLWKKRPLLLQHFFVRNDQQQLYQVPVDWISDKLR